MSDEQEQDIEDDTEAALKAEQEAAEEAARLKAEEDAKAAADAAEKAKAAAAAQPETKEQKKAREKAEREALRAQTVRKPLQPPAAGATPLAAGPPLKVTPSSVPQATGKEDADLEANIRRALERFTGKISIKFDHDEKTLHIRKQGGRTECTTLKQPVENIVRVVESVVSSHG